MILRGPAKRQNKVVPNIPKKLKDQVGHSWAPEDVDEFPGRTKALKEATRRIQEHEGLIEKKRKKDGESTKPEDLEFPDAFFELL